MAQEKQKKIQWQRGKGLSINVSPAFLSLLGVIILCVLGWCFFLGFMVGRGQNPEEHLQKMAAILSPAEKPAQTAKPQGAVPQDGVADQGAAQPAEAADGAQQQQPGQPGQPDQAGASPVPGFPAFQQGAQGAGQNAAQQAQAQDKKKPEAQAAQEKPKAPYTFSYRMATVRTREDARKEQERYEKKGFRTSIRQSGKSWSLYATIKGTDSDADQFVRDVKKAGLSQPVRVSRKAN